MSPTPKVKLSRLRDIGWSYWDPIGLLGDNQKWNDDAHSDFADEYDAYLMQAAAQLRIGTPAETVIDYLVDIEANHMGLGIRSGTVERATQVVEAMQADKDLWTTKQ